MENAGRRASREMSYDSTTPITFVVPKNTIVWNAEGRMILPGFVMVSATKLTLACYF